MDSLAIRCWIKGKRLIDIGTGAGLPGIPLAIINPELEVTLLDSNGKKTRFLREVKRTLNLNNIEIVETRAENYHPPRGFDTVTSRAFSSLTQMIDWTKHLISDEGLWLAMKGVYPQSELELLAQPWRIENYQLDGIEGERCCVLIENTKESS
jgi:16S rRNA (guanine527-N7)-methyltransferase